MTTGYDCYHCGHRQPGGGHLPHCPEAGRERDATAVLQASALERIAVAAERIADALEQRAAVPVATGMLMGFDAPTEFCACGHDRAWHEHLGADGRLGEACTFPACPCGGWRP